MNSRPPSADAARRRVKRFRFASTAALAALVLTARGGAASPLFELAGAQAGTGGYNARATGPSAASTYFNPALLGKARDSFDLGVLVLSDQISITLDGRPGGIVPQIVGERTSFHPNGEPISNATVPTDWLENGCTTCGDPPFGARPRQGAGSSGDTRAYTVLGLVDQLIDDSLVVGLYALIPIGDFTAAHSFYNDEREQFFSNSLHPEFYSDRMSATSLAFGVGSRILDDLSAGVSFTLNLTNVADANTYVRDPIDYDEILLTTDVHVRASVSPHFGIVYDVFDWLHLAGTVHTEQKLVIETGVSAALPAGQESDTKRKSVHSLLPWTFGLGAEAELNPGAAHAFALVGHLKYALWSDYFDRHGERPTDDRQGLGFGDVLSPAVGIRHQSGAVRSFVDLTFVPTPVPRQIGRKNYVDNDRLGMVVGGDYEFSLLDLRFAVGLQAQAQRLFYRHQAKNDSLIADELPDDAVDASGEPVPGAGGLQTNNPGWPGFASEGWVLGSALTASLLY